MSINFISGWELVNSLLKANRLEELISLEGLSLGYVIQLNDGGAFFLWRNVDEAWLAFVERNYLYFKAAYLTYCK